MKFSGITKEKFVFSQNFLDVYSVLRLYRQNGCITGEDLLMVHWEARTDNMLIPTKILHQNVDVSLPFILYSVFFIPPVLPRWWMGLGSCSADVCDGSSCSVELRLPLLLGVGFVWLRLQKDRCNLTSEQDKTTMLHGLDGHSLWAKLINLAKTKLRNKRLTLKYLSASWNDTYCCWNSMFITSHRLPNQICPTLKYIIN